MLLSLPLPKYVFTNADRTHAATCLRLLGIADCFDGVICFEEVMEAAAEAGLARHGRPVVCKPNRQAFEIALRLAGGGEPGTTLWLDDRCAAVALLLPLQRSPVCSAGPCAQCRMPHSPSLPLPCPTTQRAQHHDRPPPGHA